MLRKIPIDLIPHSYHESVREEMGKEVFERAKRRRSSATVIVDALVIV